MAASFSSLTLLSPQQTAAQRPLASTSTAGLVRERYEGRTAEGDASPLATLATAALAHPNTPVNANQHANQNQNQNQNQTQNQNQNQRHNYDHAHSPSLATLASAALAATPASVPGEAGAGRSAKRKSVGGDSDAMDVDSSGPGPSASANGHGHGHGSSNANAKQRLLRPPPAAQASPAHRRTRSDGSLHTGGSDLGVEGDEDELELDGDADADGDGDEGAEGGEGGGGGKDGKDGKRHTCPHCNKRFNRPSSLKIHLNTHTGAKRTSLSSSLAIFCSRSFFFVLLFELLVGTPTDDA